MNFPRRSRPRDFGAAAVRRQLCEFGRGDPALGFRGTRRLSRISSSTRMRSRTSRCAASARAGRCGYETSLDRSAITSPARSAMSCAPTSGTRAMSCGACCCAARRRSSSPWRAFRLARQFGYAWKRGLALGRSRAALVAGLLCAACRAAWPRAQPLPWPSYLAWMRLVRAPIRDEAEWNAKFGGGPREDFHLRDESRATSSRSRVELRAPDALGRYYSGYPAWKLGADAERCRIRTHSLRTNVVYGLLKFVAGEAPPQFAQRSFCWQDHGFDRWVGAHLEPCDFIHAMPGQCLHTFRAARRLGIRTVLNHATGPVREWVRIMEPEYARVGLRLDGCLPVRCGVFRARGRGIRARRLALRGVHGGARPTHRARHRARSHLARALRRGRAQFFIADRPQPPADFASSSPGRSACAKGCRHLLDALTLAARDDWRVDFYGAVLGEARHDLAAYRGQGAAAFPRAGLADGAGRGVPRAARCWCCRRWRKASGWWCRRR